MCQNRSGETECAVSKLGRVVNMLNSRDAVVRGLAEVVVSRKD